MSIKCVLKKEEMYRPFEYECLSVVKIENVATIVYSYFFVMKLHCRNNYVSRRSLKMYYIMTKAT